MKLDLIYYIFQKYQGRSQDLIKGGSKFSHSKLNLSFCMVTSRFEKGYRWADYEIKTSYNFSKVL